MNTKSQNGSAIYIVFIFSIVTLATSMIYIVGQYNFSRYFYKSPQKIQAILNARSGIWFGLNLLDKQLSEKNNSRRSIDSVMSIPFNLDLFGTGENGSDSSYNNNFDLIPGAGPIDISLFDKSKYGYFSLNLLQSGNFRILESRGFHRKDSNMVVATIGSQPFTNPDTVLFLEVPGRPEGIGSVDGTIVYLKRSIDYSDSAIYKKLFVDISEINLIVNDFNGTLASIYDSADINPPLIIDYDDDFWGMSDTVKGPLFIDGSNRELYWNEKRTIYVLEELQITGDVYIENVEFVVRGDIKILDNAELKSVNLFTSKMTFISGESIFNGTAISCDDINIFDNANIRGKSVLLSTGTKKRGEKFKITKKTPVGEQLNLFSVYIKGEALVDGVVIDLRKIGGIYTEIETIISGILLANGRICHNGRMKGVMKSTVLVDQSNVLNVTKNFLNGSIKELENIDEYYMPYFIGEAKIINWKEL
jgi:hypothetical protein